jgi:pimeloyl-ACP methyl ester carboxylesterase
MMRTRQDPIADPGRRVHFIDAHDPGVRLGLLERRGASGTAGGPPILLIHGATLGVTLFDLPAPGYSLISELAAAGRVVYALDIRGYGYSLHGAVMDAPADANPPFARLKDALRDIEAAIGFILAREQTDAVDIIGFSWGTVIAACYAAQSPQHVRRLALYAPLYAEVNEMWQTRIGDPAERSRIDPAIGAYRLVTLSDLVQRWNADIGWAAPASRRDPGMPEIVFDALAALDPQAAKRVPAAFRSPTGALADLVHVFNGKPLYDPAKLTMPVLLVRGADDTTSTDTDCRRLLDAIASPAKRYDVIAPGSHFLCVEKNRAQLYECLRGFLGDS